MTETTRPTDPHVQVPRRFVLQLVHGNLLRRRADCFVVNHYLGTQVTGAASVVDGQMGGVLSRMAARDAFDLAASSVYFVPSHYAHFSANIVAVLAMGEFERFIPAVDSGVSIEAWISQQLQQFGYNLAVACCEVDLTDVATTVHGAGNSTDVEPEIAAYHFSSGYYRGLQQAARPGHTYTLSLVELNNERIERFFNGIEGAISTGNCGLMQSADALTVADIGAFDSWVWVGDLDTVDIVKQQRIDQIPDHLRLGALLQGDSLLKISTIGSGSADQAIFGTYPAQLIHQFRENIERVNRIYAIDLFGLKGIARMESDGVGTDNPQILASAQKQINELYAEAKNMLVTHGYNLFDQLLDPVRAAELRKKIADPATDTIVLRLDAGTANIPWELLAVDGELLALTRSIGRQMELMGNVRKPPTRSAEMQDRLRVLIVANPTGDLPEVERESRRIIDMLYAQEWAEIEVTALFGPEETAQPYVKSLLNTHFDVFHYAGHAFFDKAQPAKSGLLLAGNEVLTAEMMWNLASPPGLVFFNACESAATMENSQSVEASMIDAANGEFVSELPLGSIEALLRAGTRNFIGTQWPVEDKVAAEMAIACYAELAAGESVGESLRRAREVTIDTLGFAPMDWASYTLYGSPWNRLLE